MIALCSSRFFFHHPLSVSVRIIMVKTLNCIRGSTAAYSLVQWNWFSDVTGCTWVTCIQWRQRTNFTAPGRAMLFWRNIVFFFWCSSSLDISRLRVSANTRVLTHTAEDRLKLSAVKLGVVLRIRKVVSVWLSFIHLIDFWFVNINFCNPPFCSSNFQYVAMSKYYKNKFSTEWFSKFVLLTKFAKLATLQCTLLMANGKTSTCNACWLTFSFIAWCRFLCFSSSCWRRFASSACWREAMAACKFSSSWRCWRSVSSYNEERRHDHTHTQSRNYTGSTKYQQENAVLAELKLSSGWHLRLTQPVHC